MSEEAAFTDLLLWLKQERLAPRTILYAPEEAIKLSEFQRRSGPDHQPEGRIGAGHAGATVVAGESDYQRDAHLLQHAPGDAAAALQACHREAEWKTERVRPAPESAHLEWVSIPQLRAS